MRLCLDGLLKAKGLPLSYMQTVERWISPLADQLAKELIPIKKSHDQHPLFVGVQGCQGSGKSTFSLFLKSVLEQRYGSTVAVTSLDDFYLTKKERRELAENVHPLFSTRGVPGTHDTALIKSIFQALRSASKRFPAWLPSFDKAADERVDKEYWTKVDMRVDLVIFEGWCVGVPAQAERELEVPVNELERTEDEEGTWRSLVNDALASDYSEIFSRIDHLVVLRAPNFQCVYEWRLLQERKLKAALRDSDADTSGIMNEAQIKRFVQHYQRITEHGLNTLPKVADWCFHLNQNHQIEKLETRSKYWERFSSQAV